jgi:ribonuclease P protein component
MSAIFKILGFRHEKNIPTKQNQTSKSMRIPKENENSQRKSCHQQKKKNRQKKTYHRVGLRFPKALRILSRNHFQRMHRDGKRLSGSLIYLQYQEGMGLSRLGITVSKKYGKAHDRNRFKRVVREVFREFYDKIPKGLIVHILPRIPLTPLNKHSLAEDFQSLLQQIPC